VEDRPTPGRDERIPFFPTTLTTADDLPAMVTALFCLGQTLKIFSANQNHYLQEGIIASAFSQAKETFRV
jgi:hypothetical protein